MDSNPAAQIQKSKGRLSVRRTGEVLQKLRDNGRPTDLFERHLAFEQAARDHVNMETYIIEDDGVGRRFAELLIEKQRAGVQVNLIFDSVGTLHTPKAFFDRLRAAGIRLVEFNPINAAEREVLLTTAYFVPDPQMLAAIKDAVARGVEVKLVLPATTDSMLTYYAGSSYYDELLTAGVQVFERQNAFLHSKTALIDGVWSMVGSSNMDWRSFLHNDEVNAVILGAEFGARMRQSFDADLGQSRRIVLEGWQNRPFGQRLREGISRLWQYWL